MTTTAAAAIRVNPLQFLVSIKVILDGCVYNTLLFLLLPVILIPGAIIFYIFFQENLQSPVDFYQVISSLVLDYEIQDLKKCVPRFWCVYVPPHFSVPSGKTGRGHCVF